MVLKRITAGLSAAVLAASMMAAGAINCSAEAIEADENGVYGQAGIAWMIVDLWEYRRGIEEPSLDETGENEVSGTYHDVNITGNGQYTVEMTGYCPELDIYAVGYLGLYTTMQIEEEGDVVITFDEAVIDGVSYTFNVTPQPEDSELDGKLIKIKNAYGENADTTPEMDVMVWKTPDTISITFTVSGLPTDKIEDNPDEIIEQVYGNGSVENDVTEEEPAEEESAADDGDAGEGDDKEDADAPADDDKDTKDDASSAAKSDSSSADEESGMPIGAIVGIIAGVVVVVVVIIVVAAGKKPKKKKYLD